MTRALVTNRISIDVFPSVTGRGLAAYLGIHRVGTARRIKNDWWVCWCRYSQSRPEIVQSEANAKSTLESICTLYYIHRGS